MISVAIIEDNRLIREGLASLLTQTGECSVVATASDADMELLRAAAPRVVLLDLGLHNGDSLRTAQLIGQTFPQAGVIVMDILPAHEEIMEFVNVGVAGFIMKDATMEELLSTIQSVACGHHILPPEMTSSLFSQIARESIARGREGVLASVRMTPREREVIELIKEGLSNKKIASRLSIAPQTVKSHVRNIMEKLALHTRLEIAAYGRGDGQSTGDDQKD
jgi:DNA-binding NarL/FixJ family response regulator